MADLKNRLCVGVLPALIALAGMAQAQQIERPPQEFRDSVGGHTALDLIRRAIAANADLTAARIDVERARGRLRQAGLFPNPSLDVEQTTGRLTGSAGEKEFSVGITLPIELGGKRDKRIDVATTELQAAEAEIADHERRLAAQMRSAYADALAALRELEVTSELNAIDAKTIQFVQLRVTEGDAAPLELNLLRADAERLRSRRALVQGRLETAILKLKHLAGIPPAESLRFREDLAKDTLSPPMASLEQTIVSALAARPDLRLARLTEKVAEAGLRLAQSQTIPDLSISGKYIVGTSLFDDTPVGPLRDRDKLLSFGASINLPIRNKNQGNLLDARAAIDQAQKRRESLESAVRSEVTAAYARYAAARSAVGIFQQGVIDRNTANVDAMRGAYEIGAFRITELLAEQRRLIDSQFEYTEALAESYRALSDLQAAMAAPVN